MRSQNKVASHRKRKNFIKLAKGYWGARKNVWTIAKHHIEKGLQHAYRDRKLNKRNFRSLWIVRINAAARLHGTTYSRLIHDLKENIEKADNIVLSSLKEKEEIYDSLKDLFGKGK